MSEKAYAKPLPNPSPEAARFWQGLKAHELWLPHCRPCAAFYWYPRDFCPRCGSRDVEWRRASGKGTLHTYAIQYRAWHPGWADDVPYITALIDLEEGVRIFTNLVGVPPNPKEIHCDMAVEAVFDDVTDGATLLKFRPVSA